ncbi:unnamed protein product [Plutella xylostella]|uniref:(diamondback moth) hypothetical protein n=1 Tax=Plutella xylostella TaxID=51655 RepID=A0A8S4G4G5_PLUXY|nr:unnamed protein product [Plutella xylostella]
MEPPISFVRITTRPPPALNLTGASLELTCEAMGSPAPSIQWLRDHVPVAEYDHQSNELFPSSSSVGRAVSTLIVKPTDQLVRTYTCSASAGQHSARAATRVYTHAQQELVWITGERPLGESTCLAYPESRGWVLYCNECLVAWGIYNDREAVLTVLILILRPLEGNNLGFVECICVDKKVWLRAGVCSAIV